MGILIHENDVAAAIPPVQLFKVFFLENEKYLPKILPQAIKNIEILQGDGRAGSIKKTNFAGDLEGKYVKNKIDVVDEEKLIYNYTAIEGEPWLDGVEKVSYETKTVASSNGGSVTKCTIKYYPKGDSKIDADKAKEIEDQAMQLLKAVEAYLLANPNIVN